MVSVDSPLVAVLSDDARHHFVKRVATLCGSLLQVVAMADNHGNGLQGDGPQEGFHDSRK
jgi:hypothetical protein